MTGMVVIKASCKEGYPSRHGVGLSPPSRRVAWTALPRWAGSGKAGGANVGRGAEAPEIMLVGRELTSEVESYGRMGLSYGYWQGRALWGPRARARQYTR